MVTTSRIRAYAPADAAAVDRLYRRCHPTWPAKPEGYWWGHPTLVLETDEDGLIGSTSCAVGVAPVADLVRLRQQAEVGWGHGVYVHPYQRGQGYGWALAQARHAALKAIGIGLFFGMTQPDNAAMIAIFARQGLTRHATTFPKNYPDGQTGVLYHGEIG